MVCGICRVVLKFTILALLNLPQLHSIKNGKLHSLVPRQGFTVREVMGKWFYDGVRTKAAEFCGLGRIGGLFCFFFFFFNMKVTEVCCYFGF